MVLLEDVLGFLDVEFLFCNAGGTVGMVSTVLVAWLLGAAGLRTCGISGGPVVG